MDREKVIKGLEGIKNHFHACLEKFGRTDLPFEEYENAATCALALLKEQDVVTIKKTKDHVYGVYGGICPKCHNWIQSPHSFCGFCGQAVKWE